MTTVVKGDAETRAQKLYFAAWRWHFYAGLYVIPFLLMLAITGFFMMLFTTYLPEYGDRLPVEPASQAMTVTDQMAAAMAAVPGASGIGEYATPYDVASPAIITVLAEPSVIVALDPYTGAVLRQTVEGDTWNAWLERIHSSLLIGDTGDRLIEIAAGLGLVLVATGLYLWWPRGGGVALFPDLRARGRAFWKSLHTALGIWISGVLVVFLITGMAWTGIWGERWVQAWSTFPAEKWDNVPLSDEKHAAMNHVGEKSVPWALEQTALPESGSWAGMQVLPPGTVLDAIALVDLGRAIGFEGRFRLAVPSTPEAVWTLSQDTISYDHAKPTGDRTVHVDQFTGRVLADVRFADYGLAGKAMAVGISLHEGQMGLWNFALNALFCTMVVMMCLSGLVMWWKRKPAGLRLGAPPKPAEIPHWQGAMVITIALSMLFPLVGAVLIGVLVLDVLVIQRLAPLRRLVS